MTRTRTGVRFVDSRGTVATAVTEVARGVARGTTDRAGTVTARPPCTAPALPSVDGFVSGGHDIADPALLSPDGTGPNAAGAHSTDERRETVTDAEARR